MKHLMTLVALLVSTAAVAQIPTLPWNPDGNDDQFIGLPDLLDLLTVYGQEFENAIVAEDGESAVMYMGDMQYPHCEYACEQLPGYWSMPELKDLVPSWGEVYNSTTPTTWLRYQEGWYGQGGGTGKQRMFPYLLGASNNSTSRGVYNSDDINVNRRCYCTAKQLPRVEYSYCTGQSITTCATSKVEDGWIPLGGMTYTGDGTGSDYRVGQAFWRFAQ